MLVAASTTIAQRDKSNNLGAGGFGASETAGRYHSRHACGPGHRHPGCCVAPGSTVSGGNDARGGAGMAGGGGRIPRRSSVFALPTNAAAASRSEAPTHASAGERAPLYPPHVRFLPNLAPASVRDAGRGFF